MSKLGPCDPDPVSTVPAMTDAPRDEALTDWTVDDSKLARAIMSYLGVAAPQSLEPGHHIADHVAAMIARHRAPSAPQEWRGIKDAPKDGRQVLVSFVGVEGRCVVIARWIGDEWRVGRTACKIVLTLADYPPTHWSPSLPEPPQ